MTSTTKRYCVEQIGTMTYGIVDSTTLGYVRNRDGHTRYFTSSGAARKAITRLNRAVGDRHR
jgi:hypothetical protein